MSILQHVYVCDLSILQHAYVPDLHSIILCTPSKNWGIHSSAPLKLSFLYHIHQYPVISSNLWLQQTCTMHTSSHISLIQVQVSQRCELYEPYNKFTMHESVAHSINQPTYTISRSHNIHTKNSSRIHHIISAYKHKNNHITIQEIL